MAFKEAKASNRKRRTTNRKKSPLPVLPKPHLAHRAKRNLGLVLTTGMIGFILPVSHAVLGGIGTVLLEGGEGVAAGLLMIGTSWLARHKPSLVPEVLREDEPVAAGPKETDANQT